ncbi:MAG: HAD hydrolase-like protein, partial [Pseudomonadota bacterium]
MTLKLVIFDLDGTLIDSREIIHGAMVDSFQKHTLPAPSFDEVRQVVGLGLEEACHRLAPDLSRNEL